MRQLMRAVDFSLSIGRSLSGVYGSIIVLLSPSRWERKLSPSTSSPRGASLRPPRRTHEGVGNSRTAEAARSARRHFFRRRHSRSQALPRRRGRRGLRRRAWRRRSRRRLRCNIPFREGYSPLTRWIAAHMARLGVAATQENIVVTCGSQQALDFAGKLLLSPERHGPGHGADLSRRPAGLLGLRAALRHAAARARQPHAAILSRGGVGGGRRGEIRLCGAGFRQSDRRNPDAGGALAVCSRSPTNSIFPSLKTPPITRCASRARLCRRFRRSTSPGSARSTPRASSISARSPRRSRRACASAGSAPRAP